MVRLAALIAASLLSGLLSQCGDDHPSEPARPAGAIEFTWAGGFAPRHQHLVVRPDGTGTLTEGMPDPATLRVRVDRRRLAQAQRALDDARFTDIPSEIAPTGAADAFEYTIVYRGHRVFRDESSLPRELAEPVEILRGLVETASRRGG